MSKKGSLVCEELDENPQVSKSRPTFRLVPLIKAYATRDANLRTLGS